MGKKPVIKRLLVFLLIVVFSVSNSINSSTDGESKTFYLELNRINATKLMSSGTNTIVYSVGNGENVITVPAGAQFWVFSNPSSNGYKFTVPVTSYYVVEMKGGQGGARVYVDQDNDGNPGNSAGTSCALIYLTRGQVIYIFAGGKGGNGVKQADNSDTMPGNPGSGYMPGDGGYNSGDNDLDGQGGDGGLLAEDGENCRAFSHGAYDGGAGGGGGLGGGGGSGSSGGNAGSGGGGGAAFIATISNPTDLTTVYINTSGGSGGNHRVDCFRSGCDKKNHHGTVYGGKGVAAYYNPDKGVSKVTHGSELSIANSTVRVTRLNLQPSITILNPVENKLFGVNDIAIAPRVSVSDENSNLLTCRYYIDNETTPRDTKDITNTGAAQIVDFKTLINMSTLSEGYHQIKAEVFDGEFTVQAIANFRVDKTAPVIIKLEATSTENSLAITAAASDATAGLDANPYNYTVMDGINTYQSGWKAGATHTQGSLLPNRNYTVKLEAKDSVGNIGTKSITVCTKALKPVITASNITTTAMDITAGENNPANTKYQIAVGTKYVSSGGVLTDTQQWITLTNKKIRVTGLTPNTSYSITAKAMNGANEITQASTAITKMTLPNAPENLTASPDKEFIMLTWSAMPNIIRYEVSADGAIKDAGNKTSYTHESLDPNTQHSYKVRAINAGGTGAWGNGITAATLPDPPGIPINLRAEAKQTEIIFAWDPVEGATSYDVEADGDLKPGITATTYTHTGLKADTPHKYRARAKNKGGDGNWSDIYNIGTLPEPPGIPEGLQTKEITKDAITLIWNSTERAEGYDIWVGEAIIDSTAESTYTHTGLAADTEYIYKIRARNRGGESGWTAELIVRTLPEKPSIPNNLTATSGTNEITITWDNAERAVEYDIEADGKILATITGTSYIHEGLAPDTKHTYKVKARNTGGESDYSDMVMAFTLSETTGMALTNVAAVVTNTGITLMWDAIAADTEYDIEVDGEIKDNEKNTVYVHSGLQPVTSHTYKIRPKKGEEKGPWCAVMAISTLPDPPDALRNIKALVTNTTIQLMWDAEEGATGYDIEIDGSKIESTAETTYIHKDLIPGTEHSYRIRAKNITGATPWSEAIVKSTIKPTYMIEAEAGEEYHIALTAMGMQEFKGKKIVLSYDPEEVELVDLCEETRELESGKIPGTNIQINHEPGRIEIEADKMIEPGKAWTGVVDTILIRAKVTGQISLDYVVE